MLSLKQQASVIICGCQSRDEWVFTNCFFKLRNSPRCSAAVLLILHHKVFVSTRENFQKKKKIIFTKVLGYDCLAPIDVILFAESFRQVFKMKDIDFRKQHCHNFTEFQYLCIPPSSGSDKQFRGHTVSR